MLLPSKGKNSLRLGEGRSFPEVTGMFVAEGGPESYFLSSHPDQTSISFLLALPTLVYLPPFSSASVTYFLFFLF